MLTTIIRVFYPDIKAEEITKFSLLAIILFFILGTYWMLRLAKNVFIYEVAFPEVLGWPRGYGREIIPTIKSFSPFVVIVAIGIYTKLIDLYKKHQLFYIFLTFYIAIFSFIACVMGALAAFGPQAIGPWLLAGTGVGGYLLTESYGSLLIALFWSFTISSTTTEEAKRAFPFIIAVAQIGTISGSSLIFLGLPDWLIFMLGVLFLSIAFFAVHEVTTIIPQEERLVARDLQDANSKVKPNFFAGITLLLTRPYLLGILVVSTFYDIAKTIVDYQMHSLADIIPTINFKQFEGIYGMSVNGLAFAMALLGTSVLLKKMGIQFCLLLYPAMFGFSLISLYLVHSAGVSDETLLWTTFGVMMVVSATSYAVNNPTKDMMYIPTSKDARFKTKSIIDMAGGRAAKMTGSQINNTLTIPGQPATTLLNLMTYGTLISLGIIGVWIAVAIFVGNKNKQLVRDGEIIQ